MALSNSDFMCFQKTPRGLYLGQCLVTFLLNLEVLYMYVAIMSIGAFGRLCWVSYCTLSKNLATQKNYTLCMSVLKSSTIVGHIVVTKRHLKIILSTFGAIFRRKKYHKWPDDVYITVAPKLQ